MVRVIKTIILGLLFPAGILFATRVSALEVTMTASTDGSDKPVIVGGTNLPDGITLMITIHRKESSYAAQNTVEVKQGKFQSVQFSQHGSGLNPGSYTLEVTMSLATYQPSVTWPVIGNSGEKLKGPLVQESILGGKIVKYQTSFNVGDGKSSSEKDNVARILSESNTRDWVLKSCKDTCAKAQGASNAKGEAFSYDRCYKKCVGG